MGIRFVLCQTQIPHIFSLYTEISHQLFAQRKTECTAPSFNKCTKFKITWQEVLRTTTTISYRSKIGISPFHRYFPLVSSLFIWFVRRKLSRGNDKSGQFLCRLLEFAAANHIFSRQVALTYSVQIFEFFRFSPTVCLPF